LFATIKNPCSTFHGQAGVIPKQDNSMIHISDSTIQALAAAATLAQAWLEHENGEHYPVEQLQACFVFWLESSIEQLAEEAMYHAFEGQHGYAFNREAFRDRLEKLTPAHTPQEADRLVA
jgi:hypothetical protein